MGIEKLKRIRKRTWVQIFFFLLIAAIAVNHNLVESGGGIVFLSTASIHAICPFGGVVTLYSWLSFGTFIQKIHESALILMGLVLIISLLFGPVFCGFICPFGSFQEAIGKLGKRLFKKRYNHMLPPKVAKVLRWLRYFVLARVIYMTAMSGYLVFEDIDPYNALFSFWTDEVSILALGALIVVMLLSLVEERPWCKYACPYGAVLSVFNLFSIFKLRRNASTCIACNKCSNVCPMHIDVASKDSIHDLRCIKCYQCTSENNCPVPDTVQIVPVKWYGGGTI